MINYFNFKKFNNEYLITNDFGKYQFVSFDTVKKLVNGNENIDDSVLTPLKDNFFIIDESRQAYLDKCTPYIRAAASIPIDWSFYICYDQFL